MKKLVMTGSILTLVLAIGTTAFAANTTSAAATVETENTAIVAQTLAVPAANNGNTDTNANYPYCYQGDRYCDYYVDADNDGICDYRDMHNGNGHHRGRGGNGTHHGRHHGTYGTQSSGTGTTASDYQTTGWSGSHC